MRKKDILIWSGILIVLLVVLFYSFKGDSSNDKFAQCLSDNGVKFYGAYWCSHCANQKAMFGSSFKNIDYIECSLPERAGQTEVCVDAGIKVYPTWEFGDGSRYEGELSFEQLAELGGCN